MPRPDPLWSDPFLGIDLREQPEYQAIERDSVAFDEFVRQARQILATMQGIPATDEQLTIERVITPLLLALGWPQPVPKRSLTSRDEVDLTLHSTDAKREQSLTLASEREQVLDATGIVECKPWSSRFDAPGSGARPGETAAQQLQRYLLIAGTDSSEAVRWGILTDGASWRLYSYRARPRDRTWEINLARLLIPGDLFSQQLEGEFLHQVRTAWLLLRHDSWVPAEGERESFLDRLLTAGRRSDEQLASDLSDVIFTNVYPQLVQLFWDKVPEADSGAIARAALTFLYRLLFIYYAEDRGMLDTEDSRYQPHSLRYAVRDPVDAQHGKASFSTRSSNFWQRLQALRDIIDQGDPGIGQPAYNGGLFAPNHAIVDEITLSDAELAPIIHTLSHTESGGYISYRTLEVQQLGSIYERLLERIPRRDEDGHVEVTVSPYARKDSGSYYTPQELVDLVVEQTLGPLVEERIEAFRNDPDKANDPAAALLSLKILDPAMGSGHFLITAIDWLTARILDLLERDWEHDPDYTSPLQDEIDQARAFDTTPPENIEGPLRLEIEGRQAVRRQFDVPDARSYVQRMVLKRCIYGVDKNPMAVELAKVALWLHTFRPPLPLPYLDHRIVCGDSLLGIDVDTAVGYLTEWGPDFMARGLYSDYRLFIETTASDAEALEHSLDLVAAGVHEATRHRRSIDLLSRNLRHALDLVTGFRWLSADMSGARRGEFHEPLTNALSGHVDRGLAILFNGENDEGRTPATPEFRRIHAQTRKIAEREQLIHWPIAFPHVMTGESPGFDAIIGNPPWDRIEQQEREWFAFRNPAVANLEPASRRKAAIEEGIANGDELCVQYDEVRSAARAMRLVCRNSGDYPLLSGGRTNLYSLFVERSLALINPRGVIGLLTPSGIYADHTAAEFFRSISTTGRISGIYDFENRRTSNPEADTAKWFADVDTRFKFCALITGGSERTFDGARCGFFLTGKDDLGEDSDRVFSLTPQDFARINPNTGTAPIVRNRQDAALITRIYRAHPVLVDRSSGKERKLWPVRFVQGLFNMTSDSGLFETEEQLEAAGAYRTAPNRYRRSADEWVPLYQGRMIHHYDHRANSVAWNPESAHNPYTSVEVPDEQKADANFLPRTQYWVPTSEIEGQFPARLGWTVGFRDITNATNERTMIATIVPWAGFGNKVPLLLPDPELPASDAACLVANLSSLALDYVAKRKVQGTSMNWYIAEQLPMIAPAAFDRRFGNATARELVRDHVLRLSYTARDLQPFARDLGHEGDPFPWDPAERRQLRARLDALFLHLYGLDEADAAYVLGQFPVLEKNERREHRRYLTRELVLGHYRALEAGDTAAVISPA